MELEEKTIVCLLHKVYRILQGFVSSRVNVFVLATDKSYISKHTITPWSFEILCIT